MTIEARQQRRLRAAEKLMWIGIALFFAVLVISFASQGAAFYIVGVAAVIVLVSSIGLLVNR